MVAFHSIQDGARALLVDAVNCVASTGHEFVVVGGWSPLLLNSATVPHPGTIDADLLFGRGAEEGALHDVVSRLLEAGFYPSAKHAFQLLRVITIRERRMVFNVDLLHPSEAIAGRPSNADMFVDHIRLEIPWDAVAGERFRTKSIAAPNSGFILEHGRYVTTVVEVEDVAGTRHSAEVPVIDELALLVTKSRSVAMPKRPRDSFDIWLAIEHARDPKQLLEDARDLEERDVSAFVALGEIWRVLDDGSFDRSANDYMAEPADEAEVVADRSYSKTVARFLEGADVPKPKAD